jgi:hypothetical protein
VTEATAPVVVERGWYDRVAAAMPLVTVFVWLVFLYAWESWGHVTPWLFKDELQNADLQRAIAHSGRAAVLGQPAYFESLYNYVLAPVWWIHDTHTAYVALKVVNSVVMTSALFPTYFLARMLVGKPAALFAATTASVVPAFVFTAFVVEEPAAYPWAALCFFLIVKALVERRRGWVAAALAASLAAPLVRSELAAIVGVFGLAAFFLWWTGPRASAWRSGWSRWDWAGAVVLGIGGLIALNAAVAAHSHEWLIATGYLRTRMLDYGLWAAGALTIGLGIFPVVAGIAAVFRAPGSPPRTPAERAFTAVFASGIIAFGWYTAVKAAFITLSLGRLVEERNLIYVSPLVLVAASTWLERPRVRVWAVAGAGAFVLYLILRTPYEMNYHYYADAPGLGILQSANRNLAWTPQTARHVLLLMLAVTVCVLLAPRLLRGRRTVVQAIAAAAAVLALAWNVTAQVTSASAANTFSNEFTAHIDPPLNWLDREVHGAPVLYLGQSITDQNGLQILEFWNRSIEHVWSLDGTAPPPTISPDLAQTDGRLFPGAPAGVHFVLAEPGVDVVGRTVATHYHNDAGTRKLWRVVRFTPPLRLAHSVLGIQSDGWIVSPDGKAPALSVYNRFVTPGNRAGTAIVTISRKGWGGQGPADIPGNVTIKVGTLVKRDKQPALGRVTAVRRWVVHSQELRRFHIPTPKPPFRIEVTVSPTFVEAELDPRTSDRRHLGAQVGYDFAS